MSPNERKRARVLVEVLDEIVGALSSDTPPSNIQLIDAKLETLRQMTEDPAA